MPKTKRRGKGNRSEKEKPLLTVQGVLRLDKSFITAQHDDAQTIKIKRSEDEPSQVKTIKVTHQARRHSRSLVCFGHGRKDRRTDTIITTNEPPMPTVVWWVNCYVDHSLLCHNFLQTSQ